MATCILEPLWGYILLARKLYLEKNSLRKSIYQSPFNFGPSDDIEKSVKDLIIEVIKNWEGKFQIDNKKDAPYEANYLSLISKKAKVNLNWEQKWNFEKTVNRTINWYKKVHEGSSSIDCCKEDINLFMKEK